MISITFQLDETQDLKPQIQRALAALGFDTVTYTAPIQIVAAMPAPVEENETPVAEAPAKRGRKPKDVAVVAHAPAPQVVDLEVNEQDKIDEYVEVEQTRDKLTHDDVRDYVGQYTKKFGIVAAQKNIPTILGCAIADFPDDQVALQKAIFQIQAAMLGDQMQKELDTNFFDTFDEPEVAPEREITEQDVRDALMLYAKKYDADEKMPNTLIDGPDILKKTFGPTVTALRLMPKDPESLRKAYNAINDAIENNWYNRKVQQ